LLMIYCADCGKNGSIKRHIPPGGHS
jgi:hypothetical protein